MYLLYRLQPRAETTDTVLLAVSNSYEVLQEYLLDEYNALVDYEVKQMEQEAIFHDEKIDMKNLRKWCIDRMKIYDIAWVPYMEG